MYVCILDQAGEVLVHRNVKACPEAFLEIVAPYREDLVVAVECIFTWYWLADLCAEEKLAFVLGHALYMGAIHGGKAKNDKIDSLKIATLLRGGTIPQAYVYPAGMRATRDLLRRRLHFVRKSIALDVALVDRYDDLIQELELYLVRKARIEEPQGFQLLRSIPGVGKVLAMTILYEIHDIHRFDRVQQFASYARLVRCAKESAGKKIGNVHLKWAFSEAAVLFLRHEARGKTLVARLEKKHGKGKTLSILAHKIGRAAYHMLVRGRPFELEKFMATA
jgi:transposase